MKRLSLEQKPKIRFMIDSGAFSAWKRGVEIDIDAYCDFLLEIKDYVDSYVSLDVIPGRFGGGRPSLNSIEDAAKNSWKNWKYMRKRGLNPMPVFHRGERFYWLEKILGEGCDYVGLGGIVGNNKERAIWLEQVFSFLCADRGWPPVRLHGFGVTSIPCLFNYPWYSVDSTTWCISTGFGRIFIPKIDRKKEYNYQSIPKSVFVSNASRKNYSDTDSLEKMGEADFEYVRNYIENHLGLSLIRCRQHYLERRRAVFGFFRELSVNHQPMPFCCDSLGFFSQSYQSKKCSAVNKTCIYHGTSNLFTEWELLLSEKCFSRLFSYFFHQNTKVDSIIDFIMSGEVKNETRRDRRPEVY